MYAIMNIIYGGIHLAAWTFRSPSFVEMRMWRGSGPAMVAVPAFYILAVAENKI
ncbi:hypothetical protein K469DRAFT_702583 [Zopfia rhizophila CBS 207.26]|uniref:Uncharacterized protein n=1 Tax=Zopfia rhizophila CBS 207.26 TaxID=1314779 RepID=A0A6A6ECV3_9PEZI|nr:hypothetical protein K469DRAFT_702583 [Zopfia rhizophila CBS 207.26]